jgi:hypothetical protein
MVSYRVSFPLPHWQQSTYFFMIIYLSAFPSV